jgi:hypothetical protein
MVPSESIGSITASIAVRSIAIAAVLLTLGSTTSLAAPQSLEVLGQVGVLGEWELTANLAATSATRKEFSGPLVMKHVGLCTQDGPEVKKGELRVQLAGASRIKATLVMEGATTCTYLGQKSDAYKGMMRCPDQREVPLLIWLK